MEPVFFVEIQVCPPPSLSLSLSRSLVRSNSLSLALSLSLELVVTTLSLGLQAPADCLSAIYTVLARRRGHVTQDIPKVTPNP